LAALRDLAVGLDLVMGKIFFPPLNDGCGSHNPIMRTGPLWLVKSAQEALDACVYRLACQIGSLAPNLGGLDTMVFTAGVGEYSAPIRQAVAQRCAWLGVKLDEAPIFDGKNSISRPGSA